jgi:hypothetical protein
VRWDEGDVRNSTTKAVKVQRPSVPEGATATKEPSPFPYALSNNWIGASLGYRYYFDGKEYSSDEAGQLVKQRGTVG